MKANVSFYYFISLLKHHGISRLHNWVPDTMIILQGIFYKELCWGHTKGFLFISPLILILGNTEVISSYKRYEHAALILWWKRIILLSLTQNILFSSYPIAIILLNITYHVYKTKKGDKHIPCDIKIHPHTQIWSLMHYKLFHALEHESASRYDLYTC